MSRRGVLHSSHKRACLRDETMTMTEILQQAFYKAAELPEDRQEAFARFLLAELESERQWEELFSRPESEDFLERMASEALEAHRAGQDGACSIWKIFKRALIYAAEILGCLSSAS